MIWPYLIIFDEAFASRKEVTDFLNSIEDEVPYWYACFPNCVFFTSTMSANELAERFWAKFDVEKGQKFLICEVPDDRQGRLPKEAWKMFGEPSDPRIRQS
jgi:hypothetical protein